MGFTGGKPANPTPATVSSRKPTSLQEERRKTIQKAGRKGMSLRAVKRALGIHRASIKKYMDADGSLDGGLGHLSPRQALVQCRYERVTFMLNP